LLVASVVAGTNLAPETAVSFGAKHFLLGLLVIPLLAILLLWTRARARRDLKKLFGQGLSELQLPESFWRRRAWRNTLVLLGLASALLALSQPRWGHSWKEREITGLEVVVALDISRSMDAQDVDPSRIERARREILDLLDALPQARVGLVVFAGGAYPRMPQTLDHKALRSILKRTDTQTIRAQGSSIASALQESLGLMDLERNADRALVLLSDGEGWDPALDTQMTAIREAGVRIYSVGIGTEAGAPIPNANGGFKKNRQGEVIITKLQEPTLKQLAEDSGGAYLHSVGGASDTRELVGALNAQLQASSQGQTREKIWNERFQWPLGLAILLLFFAAFSSDARWASGLLLVWGLALPGPAQAEETVDVRDPRTLWSLALNQTQSGDHEEAYRTFSEIAERAIDPQLRLGARYNAGNAAYGAGRLEQAVQAWDQALEMDPSLESAQKNSEAVRQEIAQRLQEPPPEEQEPEDSEDGEEGEEGEEQDENSESEGDEENQSSDGEREPSEPKETEDEQQEDDAMPEASGEPPEGEEEEQPLAQGVQEMSPEEALRLLEAVEEGRPFVVVPGNSSQKDW
jgi:Ca-activated chloride channel family protein